MPAYCKQGKRMVWPVLGDEAGAGESACAGMSAIMSRGCPHSMGTSRVCSSSTDMSRGCPCSMDMSWLLSELGSCGSAAAECCQGEGCLHWHLTRGEENTSGKVRRGELRPFSEKRVQLNSCNVDEGGWAFRRCLDASQKIFRLS